MADTASKEMSVFIPLQGMPIENEQSLSWISDPVRMTATPSISRVSTEYRVMSSDPVLIDVRGMFGEADADGMGFCYRGL